MNQDLTTPGRARLELPAFLQGGSWERFPCAPACARLAHELQARAPREDLLAALRAAMQATPQGAQSVWEHCEDTAACARVLLGLLHSSPTERAQRLEALGWSWVSSSLFDALAVRPLEEQAQADLLQYLAWHDCGKPWCWSEDEQGRVHFEDHAACSAQLWLLCTGEDDQAWLMAHDMDLHRCSAEQLQALAGERLCPSLLLAGWASLAANAQAFGGQRSPSFLAKRKHLERRTKALVRAWSAQPDCDALQA